MDDTKEKICFSDFKISLAAARVNANMTQEDVATVMRKSKNTIVNWESGKNIPDVAQVAFLANLYGVPIELINLQNNFTNSE